MVKKVDGSPSFTGHGPIHGTGSPGRPPLADRSQGSPRKPAGPLSGLTMRRASPGSPQTGVSVKPRLKIASLQARGSAKSQASRGNTRSVGHEAATETRSVGHEATAESGSVGHEAAAETSQNVDDTLGLMNKLSDEGAKQTIATALIKQKMDLAAALADAIKSVGTNIRNASN